MIRGFGFIAVEEGDTLLDVLAAHHEIEDEMADYDMEDAQ